MLSKALKSCPKSNKSPDLVTLNAPTFRKGERPKFELQHRRRWGSGCGSVGRAVTSDTRGSSHWQTYIEQLFTVNCIEKTKMKKKRPGMAHLKSIVVETTLIAS